MQFESWLRLHLPPVADKEDELNDRHDLHERDNDSHESFKVFKKQLVEKMDLVVAHNVRREETLNANTAVRIMKVPLQHKFNVFSIYMFYATTKPPYP